MTITKGGSGALSPVGEGSFGVSAVSSTSTSKLISCTEASAASCCSEAVADERCKGGIVWHAQHTPIRPPR